MTLTYDVDIAYIMPEDVFSDPNSAALIKQTGIELNSRGNYVAKFRDPKTAAALNGASESVKAFFKASGFAFIPSGVSLPEGRFDARFDNHVTDVLKRLEENIHQYDLPKGDTGPQGWNGFNIGELTVWFSHCKPIDCTQSMANWAPPTRRKSMPSLLHIGFLGFLAAAVYAIS